MKIIKKIIISLVIIVAILAVTIIGGYIYIRKTYGIDLFRTTGQLKTLSKEVDESKICPNAYDDNDFIDMKTEVNKKIEGLISYEEGKGYKGYSVNLTSLVGKSMTGNLLLTEKQVGAIAQTVFYEQTGGKIKLGEKEVSVTIVQVDFSEIAENGSANFNVVSKLDLTPFKEDMKKFPYKYLKKYIPNSLYISSTVRIEKTGKDFSYGITHKSLTLNNLSSDDTADFFDTLNAVLKIGTAENLNMQIGKIAVDALIGTKENPGFAYAMKSIGAISFKFENSLGVDYFVVY